MKAENTGARTPDRLDAERGDPAARPYRAGKQAGPVTDAQCRALAPRPPLEPGGPLRDNELRVAPNLYVRVADDYRDQVDRGLDPLEERRKTAAAARAELEAKAREAERRRHTLREIFYEHHAAIAGKGKGGASSKYFNQYLAVAGALHVLPESERHAFAEAIAARAAEGRAIPEGDALPARWPVRVVCVSVEEADL